MTIRGSRCAQDRRISGVRSVDPSSTISSSKSVKSCAMTLSMASPTNRSRLKTGMRTVTRGFTRSSLVVAVHDLDVVALPLQFFAEPLRDGDAAVTPAGAADPDRQVALHLFLVLRNEI